MSSMPAKLYHATLAANVPDILDAGLLREKCGAVHGETEVHPEGARVYLSANSRPDNLCADLFAAGEVVVLEVDATRLNADSFYPDDFLLDKVASGEMFEGVKEIAEATGMALIEAESLAERLDECVGADFAETLKPLAAWYAREHGEVSYVGDVPSEAIISVRPYEAHERDVVSPADWPSASLAPT